MTLLSIIVPAYNEELRLGPTLESLETYISGRPGLAEIIVVDDGSTDATSDVAVASGCSNLRVMHVDRNMGKGHAVRIGMLAASGDRRLFVDADGSTPIGEMDRLELELDRIGGSGVAFASIAVPGAHVLHPQPGLRPIAGRVGLRCGTACSSETPRLWHRRRTRDLDTPGGQSSDSNLLHSDVGRSSRRSLAYGAGTYALTASTFDPAQ